jgi:uncharacterized protein
VRRPFGRCSVAILLCLASGAAVAAQKIPPPPGQWLTDEAGFLTPAAAGSVNAELRALEERTGRQVLVYIGRTTDGVPIEDFAVKAFEAWKPGRKGLDDGLAIFIMAEDRKIRIEVGYGLEEILTDAKASRIINEIMLPRIRSGDNDGAVRSAVEAVAAAIGGGDVPAAGPNARSGRKTEIPGPIVIIAVVIFLLIFIKNPAFALWLLFNILGGGRGGGGGFGGGGGGFRGGGGRSGGGGASGGW